MVLSNPEIRQQVEALTIGQSVEFKFDNGGSGCARRTLVLKVIRGSQDDVSLSCGVIDRPAS